MAIALIMAAGKGTRMRSGLPKPIVPVMGKPMVAHIIDRFYSAGIEDIYLVVGHGAAEVKEEIGENVHYVYQKEQKGTADAVWQLHTLDVWRDTDVFVFVGDSPLITTAAIKALEKKHRASNASCTFLTALFPVSMPYARVIRNEEGTVTACVEEKNASVEQRQIRELLTSHFIFRGNDLFSCLPEIQADPDTNECYLTDIIGIFLSKGLTVETACMDQYEELTGLNTPEEVAWAEAFMKQTNSH